MADWSGDIELLALDGADQGTVLKSIHETAYAISVQFQESDKQPPRLLAGLSDGTFVSYSIKPEEVETADSRHASSLGLRPLRLIALDISPNAEEHVVAAGISDRLSLVFESRGHYEFSSSGKKVMLPDCAKLTSECGRCYFTELPESWRLRRLGYPAWDRVRATDESKEAAGADA